MLHHQTEVGCDIGLTLYRVDNHALGLCCGGRSQFDEGGETGTTHTYDTCILDTINNLLGGQFRMSLDGLQFVRAIDSLLPLITLDIDDNHWFAIARGVDGCINLEDRTTDRRIDRSRHEATSLGKQCSHLHLVTLCNNRLGWGTDMLTQREDSLLGKCSHLRHGIVGQFILLGVYTTYTECSYIHNGYLLFI